MARIAAFLKGLAELGWTDGRNVRIEYRWGAGNADPFAVTLWNWLRSRRTSSWPWAPRWLRRLQATRTVPIVFANVTDPVGGGLVASLARPGGSATGFILFEYGMSGKWLELLKEIAPAVTRSAVLRDPAVASGIGQFAIIQSVAPSFGVELRPIDLRDAREIERAVAAFGAGRTAA